VVSVGGGGGAVDDVAMVMGAMAAAVKVEERDGARAEDRLTLASPSPSSASEGGSYGALARMSPFGFGSSPAEAMSGRRYSSSSVQPSDTLLFGMLASGCLPDQVGVVARVDSFGVFLVSRCNWVVRL
jgi:hypothetical protein